MAFSALCTQIWKLNRISMTVISKVAGGNHAVGLESMVKIATLAGSPYQPLS